MNYIDFVGGANYLPINRNLLRSLGPVETVLYSELIDEFRYWEKEGKLDEEEMFFSTVENIEDRTGIGRNQQTAALKSLKEKGLILVKKKGLPARRYIKVVTDDAILRKYFESNSQEARKTQKAENQLTGQLENSSLVNSNSADKSTENQSVTILNKQPNINKLTQQPQPGCCCSFNEIKKIIDKYKMRVWEPEVIEVLSEHTQQELEKICKFLAQKKASGEITNPGGYLSSHPKEICEAILAGPSKKINDNDYPIYVPPVWGG